MIPIPDWIPTTRELPPEEQVVETFHAANHSRHIRRGKRWFKEDQNMAVYFTPDFWRPVPAKGDARPQP